MNELIRFNFSSHTEDLEEVDCSTSTSFSACNLDEVMVHFEKFLRGVGYKFADIQVTYPDVLLQKQRPLGPQQTKGDLDFFEAEKEFWSNKVESAKYNDSGSNK